MTGSPATGWDLEAVSKSLGRLPGGNFTVAARRPDGHPMVICNEPLLRDGTPMPTRYWLVDPQLRSRVSRLEADGGVREAESTINAEEIAECHARYAREREEFIPSGWTGPRPTGGVGGTRHGVKCLHAHLAWWLVGGNDPVGTWAAEQLGVTREGPYTGTECDDRHGPNRRD
jgi:uncharacterized protein